jgi:hypothetical protein
MMGMDTIWQRGDDVAEIVRKDGTWQLLDGNGELIMRGWRAALESWLRRAGYVEMV